MARTKYAVLITEEQDIIDELNKKEAFKLALDLYHEGKDIFVMTYNESWDNGYASQTTHYEIDDIKRYMGVK